MSTSWTVFRKERGGSMQECSEQWKSMSDKEKEAYAPLSQKSSSKKPSTKKPSTKKPSTKKPSTKKKPSLKKASTTKKNNTESEVGGPFSVSIFSVLERHFSHDELQELIDQQKAYDEAPVKPRERTFVLSGTAGRNICDVILAITHMLSAKKYKATVAKLLELRYVCGRHCARNVTIQVGRVAEPHWS